MTQHPASAASISAPVDTTRSPHARLRTLPVNGVTFTGGLWAERQSVNRRITLPHGYRMLDHAGNLHDLRLAAGLASGAYRGPRYIDSDLYKWLEALPYEMLGRPDAALAHMQDEVIDLIRAAQTPEGYLNSYYQVAEPHNRWAFLDHGHELYCAGHLIQAAVAHYRCTGSTRLLDVARRFADHIDSLYGPGKAEGLCGHPEIEMALVELYRETRERRYLNLAGVFLDRRGYGRLGTRLAPGGSAYFCDHVPVREASSLEGHAVRALYLVAGVTDVYIETGERALLDAVLRQWEDMTARKLFITGGLGPRHEGEAFGGPYEFTTDRSYCETCAAIASIFWNWRMLLVTGESRFADLIELTLYNGFLSGLSRDGTHFFYVNPLLSRGGIERTAWYGCACCPPNIMRLLSTLGHYVATADASGLQVHQYAQALLTATPGTGQPVRLRMDTMYPWEGRVRITVEQTGDMPWALSLRVPAWCDAPPITLNGALLAVTRRGEGHGSGGYAVIERTWQPGDSLTFTLNLTPQWIEPHPRVDAMRGSVAIRRGPVVYCVEQADQEPGIDVQDIAVDAGAVLREHWRPDLLGGVMTLQFTGSALDLRAWDGLLYRPAQGYARERATGRLATITAIPYYAWANRGAGAMRVWIPQHASYP